MGATQRAAPEERPSESGYAQISQARSEPASASFLTLASEPRTVRLAESQGPGARDPGPCQQSPSTPAWPSANRLPCENSLPCGAVPRLINDIDTVPVFSFGPAAGVGASCPGLQAAVVCVATVVLYAARKTDRVCLSSRPLEASDTVFPGS